MATLKLMTTIGLIFLLLWLLLACQSGPPLQANAGDDFSVQVGQPPTFDGCASTGQISNYKWTIVSAPDQVSEDVGKVIREVDANCSFTLEAMMGVDEVGEWVIELEVRDGQGNTSTDTVRVEVVP